MHAECEAPKEQATRCTRILLADDNAIFLERVVALLTPSFDVVATARNGEELITKAIRLAPDIVVADITMPICNGLEATRRLREARSSARVIFLTIHDEGEFVEACIEAGASGYVVKSRMAADLLPAIRAALGGDLFLSPILAR